MSNGQLTFTIGGREALPVRAIPYVTGWHEFTPDVVARHLARGGLFMVWSQPLVAYHLPDDTPVPVLPREWDAVVATFEGYEAELKQQHPDDAIGYAAWRKGAAGKLPEGVFVWLDEFEKVYKARQERMLSIEPRRAGDDELIPVPMLDDATRAMVLAGFVRRPNESNNPKDEATRQYEQALPEAAGDAEKISLREAVTKARPVSRGEIEAAFPIKEGWGDRLQKAPSGRYKWLDGTWVRKGTRRPGDATTYNPAAVAVALVVSGKMKLSACKLVMQQSFPDWFADWESKAEYLEN